MRLFIAVNFDDEIKNRLLSIQSNIIKQSLKGNYSKAENLHLTLVFLGETPSEQVSLICSVMGKICQPYHPFNLDFNHTGFFKHSNKELWWMGSDNTASGFQHVKKLHQNLSDGLYEAGINFDKRPFRPHITLGREIKRSQPINLAKENINIPINRISLMQSERVKSLLVYTEIGYSVCTGK